MAAETLCRKLRIFLSHLTVEARFADALKKHIVQDFIGLVDVFVASDATSIPAGAQWLAGILEALKAAHLQLILCSKEAVTRPWIHYEAGAARLRGIPIVTLCHSDMAFAQLPVPLSESEGIDLNAPDGLPKLYATIADLLGSDVPSVDFDAYVREFRHLEEAYACQRPRKVQVAGTGSLTRIPNPRVVCATSKQFRELGFENQLQTVLDAFPSNLQSHEIVTSSDELRRSFMREKVDILHIATFVCPRGGAVYFSPVDLPSGQSSVPEDAVDKMQAETLVALLRESQTALVVVGSCESLALATTLLTTTDVVAAHDMVSAKAMAAWVDTFYKTLRTKPLADAYTLATEVSRAPMKLYGRQAVLPNLQFNNAESQDKSPPSSVAQGSASASS